MQFDSARGPAVAALLVNAFVWGVSWWPFRAFDERGVHPLWTTVFIYVVAVAAISVVRPRAWGVFAATPGLWLLAIAAGATNVTFNWGVTIGDVVRVVLLFYLMPLWALLIARYVLGEPFTLRSVFRVLLALTGAAIVLWPEGGGIPAPTGLGDWLGLAGGAAFAINNVLLRRAAGEGGDARALAMLVGGIAVAAPLALALGATGTIAGLPSAATLPYAGLLAMAAFFLAGNLALQYGAARLPASVTSVVMISEVLFASVSAALAGAGVLSGPVVIGGMLIIVAALLASISP